MIYSENILICIAIPLLVILPFVSGSVRRFCIALMSGMFMCLLGAYLNSFFGLILDMNETEIARYVAPNVEEIMRLLPILVYMLLLVPENVDLLSFATGVGAGFATFENCCYITLNDELLVRFVLIRGLAVGVMHVTCGIIIGMGLLLVRKYKSIMIPGTIGIFTFAMTTHALYNLLVSAEGFPVYVGFAIPICLIISVYLLWDSRKQFL